MPASTALTMADSPARPSLAHPRPRSTDLSSLYMILPSAVQSRIPRLTSLRRSMTMSNLRSFKSQSLQYDERNRPTNTHNELVMKEQVLDIAMDKERRESSASSSSGRSTTSAETVMADVNSETASGVRWNRATAGMRLTAVSSHHAGKLLASNISLNSDVPPP